MGLYWRYLASKTRERMWSVSFMAKRQADLMFHKPITMGPVGHWFDRLDLFLKGSEIVATPNHNFLMYWTIFLRDPSLWRIPEQGVMWSVRKRLSDRMGLSPYLLSLQIGVTLRSTKTILFLVSHNVIRKRKTQSKEEGKISTTCNWKIQFIKWSPPHLTIAVRGVGFFFGKEA